MNKICSICLLLIAVSLTGCSSLPKEYAATPTRSLVQGDVTTECGVLIRSVDGGPVIWIRGHRLGSKVWLDPGVHKLSVMCSSSTVWGAYTIGTEVEVQIESGFNYLISSAPIKNRAEKPQVTVVKQAKK